MYHVECICNRACLIMIMNSTIQTQLIVRVTRENNIKQMSIVLHIITILLSLLIN